MDSRWGIAAALRNDSSARWQLSNSDDDFVADCAPQTDAYKKISCIEEIIRQSDNHLGKPIEAWHFTDILYFQRIYFVSHIFCLSGYNRDVFAGQQIKTNGKERDTRALIKAEVVQGCERERIAHEGN